MELKLTPQFAFIHSLLLILIQEREVVVEILTDWVEIRDVIFKLVVRYKHARV